MKMLRNKISCVLGCVLVLCVVHGASADENHYVNMLVGNRASGLGGAYTAVSDDPAGCFYNPAGIAFSPYLSISASVNAFSVSTKTYKDALRDISGNTIDWTQESSNLLPNFFGMVRQFGPGKIGFSYGVPDSIQRQQKQTFRNIRSYLPDNPIETYTININDNDKTYLLGPSYAFSVSDSFSIGATLYAYYRSMEIIRTQFLQFDQGEHYMINYYETKEDWGYKPIIGAIWEPLDKLAVGLTISKIYVASSDNERQVLFRDTSSPVPYLIDSTIYDFTNTDAIYFTRVADEEKDKFPLTTALGVAYFASPRLLFSGDITYYQEISDKEATYNFSLGTEYYFTERFAGRAGFFTDNANTPSLSSTQTDQPENVDIYGLSLSITSYQKRSGITLGMMYSLGKGDAQVVANSTAIQDVEISNFIGYLSASYSY
ncbi:MAG: hypothetical protein JRF35_08690 [Deltaproteobacteria bacterium]|nr:hypothetical protein [Deltaproteobacteria bacterium]